MTTSNILDSKYYYSFDEVKQILPVTTISRLNSEEGVSKEFSRSRMISMVAIGALMILAGVFIILDSKGIIHLGLNSISHWGTLQKALEVGFIGGGIVTLMIGYGAHQKSIKDKKEQAEWRSNFIAGEYENEVQTEITSHLQPEELFVIIYPGKKHAKVFAKNPEEKFEVSLPEFQTVAESIQRNFGFDPAVQDKTLVSLEEMAKRLKK